MNWYHKEIALDKLNVDITDIMEWIRDNGCPNLDCTIFYDAMYNSVIFGDYRHYMVSLVTENEVDAILDDADENDDMWVTHECMKAYRTPHGWVLIVNDNYYWTSKHR